MWNYGRSISSNPTDDVQSASLFSENDETDVIDEW
jgi:hypothetical protein